MKIGIDIGSTTLKCTVIDDWGNVVYRFYERHYSQIRSKTAELIKHIKNNIVCGNEAEVAISGSAGMGISDSCNVPFVQEVYSTRIAIKKMLPKTDVAIELGGEDAKILFLTGGLEVRMNGSCAGGTGAFIDQMSTLLAVTPTELNELAKQADKLYTIASRCGVFAKSDIQPLLNQGAKKNDIAKSIFNSVVNQTVAGLAQGRPIAGNVAYLGGPLTFFSELRESFDTTLSQKGVCPEDSLYYVALGAALSSDVTVSLDAIIEILSQTREVANYHSIHPLFSSEQDYDDFSKRHAKATVVNKDASSYSGDAHIGIDAGSTTIKIAVISDNGSLLLSVYRSNNGNPVPIIREFLQDTYKNYPNINIVSATATGYGEELIKNAFSLDFGVVETVAHYTAAARFKPNVEFIIDIGGQDIKCFKIRNGAIDSIFLNEACSSGCGSFLQTFAGALGQQIEDFAKLGLLADKPVDLGSRCTVFMNSSVKQAQKDGATIENISAGLSISVVKNALYKVIRPGSLEELGKNIVVQGGTFLNDAVLRAFEMELGISVVRPTIAGLMGAYGAALYGMSKQKKEKSSILSQDALNNFSHTVKDVNCGLCPNNCRLTVNVFDGGRKYISGNRCERPVSNRPSEQGINLYEVKLNLLNNYKPVSGSRGKIGIPMGLNFYELLPFWHTFFTKLGFEVVTSGNSNNELYLKGQSTIPSDTVCYPAKLMHGHVQQLIDSGVDTIFYPCATYNFDEKLGDNHYNCPVVAYYPEVIGANMPGIKSVRFIQNYVGMHRKKDFSAKLCNILSEYYEGITLQEVKNASKAAYLEHDVFMERVSLEGDAVISRARELGMQIIVLAGRPYHIDPEINHGIDKLLTSLGVAVISEDAISRKEKKPSLCVLNQWSYHARLYTAANHIIDKKDMQLVQLVSFGCGIDAVTTDEVCAILERSGKMYTQIKDEITNLGAVKIRLRSLLAAIEQ